MSRLAPFSLVLLLAAASVWAQTAATSARSTSCVQCHGALEGEPPGLVADFMEADVHRTVGLSCHHCHGGNPSPDVADDTEAAMDPSFAANPYIGVPRPAAVPELCGRCHSSPAFMRRFAADPRVDQVAEYWTSQHGIALRRGDTNVATCISCHGVHGMRGRLDPEAPIHPTRVAETCGACHADADKMRAYGIPVDQLARWRRSVHAAALLAGGDLSAPTCNDCHGDHGAVPPGISSITYICGSCHGRQATLFRNSPKEEGFQRHQELIADGERCEACHESSVSQARLGHTVQFSECTTCHGNHGVVRATIAMLSPLPDTPCIFCHGEGDAGAAEGRVAAGIRAHFAEVHGRLLAEATAMGLDREERFNWLIGQAEELPFHTHGQGAERVLREQFARFWSKFRIGRSYYTFRDPESGREVRSPVLRCSDCHAAQPEGGGEAVGHRTAVTMIGAMQELTATTARAERLLLAARRGGVETGPADAAIDQAVDTMIQLEVLVHTFTAGEGSEFTDKEREGLEHAASALQLAHAALGELQFRRAGLAASLVVIVLVLVALAMKIRQLGPG